MLPVQESHMLKSVSLRVMKQNVPRLCTGLGVLRVVVRTKKFWYGQAGYALLLGRRRGLFDSTIPDFIGLQKSLAQNFC